MQLEDAAEFAPATGPVGDPAEAWETLPRAQEFATVGHFYRGIAAGFAHLCERLGESAVFVGPPRAQATPELFRWPSLIAVTDLASARAAIEEIIEQGEGAQGDWRNAHYGRFLAITEEYEQLRERDPSFQPARPVLAAHFRQPYGVVAPQAVVTDPQAAAVAELASIAYELVLHLLTRHFTHTDETDEQLGVLVGIAIGVMRQVLRPLAGALTLLPVGPEHPGRTAGFGFGMYYTMSNYVPAREPSWALLHERMRLLAVRCGDLARTGCVPHIAGPAGAQATGFADTLAAHVPASMLPRRG
jgi:hypothetical protein